MFTKIFFFVITVAFLFAGISNLSAQEKEDVKKPTMQMHKMTSDSTMMKDCMDKIASNEGMRSMMMNKMMKSSEGDENGMMEMCKTMMNNPEMHSMMMKMMGGEMMKDKSNSKDEGGNNSDYESHHKNKSNGNN